MAQYKDLLLPLLRNNLIRALEGLANIENQLLVLPKDNYVYAFSDSILRTIDVFDKLDMQDSPPKDHIGYTLYNNAEAQVVSQVITAITSVCDKIGTKQSDSAYINSSLWEKVICIAKHAHNLLLANEQYGLFEMEYDAHGYEIADFDLKENSKASIWGWWDRCRLSKQDKNLVAHDRSDQEFYNLAEMH